MIQMALVTFQLFSIRRGQLGGLPRSSQHQDQRGREDLSQGHQAHQAQGIQPGNSGNTSPIEFIDKYSLKYLDQLKLTKLKQVLRASF